jgi:hypothetical protein
VPQTHSDPTAGSRALLVKLQEEEVSWAGEEGECEPTGEGVAVILQFGQLLLEALLSPFMSPLHVMSHLLEGERWGGGLLEASRKSQGGGALHPMNFGWVEYLCF